MPKPGAKVPTIPEGTRKMVLCVPDSVEWLTLVTGVLAQIQFGWYWNKDSGDWEAAVQRARQMYFEFQDQNGLCDVIDCDDVADCIENSDSVKDALSAYINNTYNSGIAGSGEMSDEDKNANLLGQAGCSNDIAWGNALNIVQSLNRRNTDFLETLEALTNNQEAIDYIIQAIPIIETLPIDDLISVADKVRSWLTESYLAGYDLDYELERACEIFCLITNSPTCELTYVQLRDFYWDKARTIAVFSDAFQSAVNIIEAWANWDEAFGEIVVDIMCAMQFGFMNFLNSGFGYTFKQFKVSTSAGVPDDDWTINCDDCPEPITPEIGIASGSTCSAPVGGENLTYGETGLWTADGTLSSAGDVRVTIRRTDGTPFKYDTFTANVGIAASAWTLANDDCDIVFSGIAPTNTLLKDVVWAIQNTGTPLHVSFRFYE